ncbi:MAG: alpha/beta hydrolase [Crocinitomicaceae bacterium]|nr:alpha/beta hydrolase [Crocinitomicaceae bacterium]
MIDFKDKIYEGAERRPSLWDCRIPVDAKGVIIFIHGYKGYKDWGCWQLVEDKFVQNGYGFVKYNISHNGGTVKQKIDFPDPDAFGKNCYSYEVFDLEKIITETKRILHDELNSSIPIYLIGHSRGGGVAILEAAVNQQVAALVSWAGISDIACRFPEGEELEFWQQDGVRYVENARTKQNLPHYFSFYEDFINNQDRFDIEKAARSLTIPFLQIHGDMDSAVSVHEGQELSTWTNTTLEIIKGADHTFGSAHPWSDSDLPEDLEEVCQRTISFFNKLTF